MKENKTNATLVIMAAGIGSRYGGGIKQLEAVGPNGEIIMDYSIFDAVRAGFNKVIFIIRKDIEKDFLEIIGNRVAKFVDVEYAFQELDDIPKDYEAKRQGRTKPWGTGQAVLACRGLANEPFVVINADDYYGREAFQKVYDWLTGEHARSGALNVCMVSFLLGNTLSDNGSVTRGVCRVDRNRFLEDVEETYNIIKTKDGAGTRLEDGSIRPIPFDARVSMNMWGLYPEFFDVLEEEFTTFLNQLAIDDKKREYLLPILIGQMVHEKKVAVEVLSTGDKWFGVTYKEDKESVRQALEKLIHAGVYPTPLY